MTVSEMLHRISSHELTEWRAYEQQTGLLGPRWDQEMQREIHFMLQALRHTMVQLKTEKGKNNPIPEPKRVPGPAEFVNPEEFMEDEEEEV